MHRTNKNRNGIEITKLYRLLAANQTLKTYLKNFQNCVEDIDDISTKICATYAATQTTIAAMKSKKHKIIINTPEPLIILHDIKKEIFKLAYQLAMQSSNNTHTPHNIITLPFLTATLKCTIQTLDSVVKIQEKNRPYFTTITNMKQLNLNKSDPTELKLQKNLASCAKIKNKLHLNSIGAKLAKHLEKLMRYAVRKTSNNRAKSFFNKAAAFFRKKRYGKNLTLANKINNLTNHISR